MAETLTEELNRLRLAAFKSNKTEDRHAYFDKLSRSFQRDELVEVSRAEVAEARVSQLEAALVALRDEAYPPDWLVSSRKPFDAAIAQADAALGRT